MIDIIEEEQPGAYYVALRHSPDTPAETVEYSINCVDLNKLGMLFESGRRQGRRGERENFYGWSSQNTQPSQGRAKTK